MLNTCFQGGKKFCRGEKIFVGGLAPPGYGPGLKSLFLMLCRRDSSAVHPRKWT